MPPLSLLLKPASSACNLRCAYCFYADEAQKRQVANYGMMPEEVARAVVEKSFAAAEGSVSILFQGGEPTLAGLDFYAGKETGAISIFCWSSRVRRITGWPCAFLAIQHCSGRILSKRGR